MEVKIINLMVMPYLQTYRQVEYVRNGKTYKRKIKLKEPIPHFRATYKLAVPELLGLNHVYMDEHGQKYVVTVEESIDSRFAPHSELTKVCIEPDILKLPTRLQLIQQHGL